MGAEFGAQAGPGTGEGLVAAVVEPADAVVDESEELEPGLGEDPAREGDRGGAEFGGEDVSRVGEVGEFLVAADRGVSAEAELFDREELVAGELSLRREAERPVVCDPAEPHRLERSVEVIGRGVVAEGPEIVVVVVAAQAARAGDEPGREAEQV